ncbi:actin-related protein 5-like isoform X1 [Mytilus trossulus]|uniref:actin-related protein 5-like isoform X1 n=2 Tax=Mytilus trossulus TaxID=6551 RepID=UPI003004ADA9
MLSLQYLALKMTDQKNIFTFKDERPQQCPSLEYSTDFLHNKVPLVIDNGTYQCRAGWATSDKPQLIFKNITAKPRGKKETDTQVGNEINTTEVAKWLIRSPFDRNVVTLYDVQEQIFDYIFTHLGLNTDGYIDHPVVLTEPVCNPNYCRQQMSELLFECYNIPQVTYGIDAMFSLYANHDRMEDINSLIVSCGYQTTHLLPVLGGRLDTSQCRRINLGGYHLETFMQRLLQLKYPGHFAAVSLNRAEELVRDHCHLAPDYNADLHEWVSNDYYDENVHKIQLPYTNAPGNQLSAEQTKERREQQIKRLKEVTAKRRLEKLASEEQKLQELMSIQELLEDEDDDEAFDRALQNTSFDTPEELQAEINRLTIAIQRNRAKVLGIEPPPAEEPKKQTVYDLLEIPDDQLSADQVLTKKKQRMLKNAREGRLRAQALQIEKRQKEMEEERKLEQRRRKDFNGWLQEVRGRRQKLLDARTSRKQKKSDMAKRRTLASQQRMKMITQLAAGESSSTKKKADTFGQNDADWDVYKEIHPQNADSDSEVEEEQIEELEAMLREHDPEFQKELDLGGSEEFDIAEYYRLHLAIERVRVPELLFQPSMIGVEQAGIVETMDFLLHKYDQEKQKLLVQNVFLTGGNALFMNFKERLEKELLEMRPFQSMFSVTRAVDPVLDAWKGARKFAISPDRSVYSITKADYTEMGGEYLKEHFLSNRYFPSPVSIKLEK